MWQLGTWFRGDAGGSGVIVNWMTFTSLLSLVTLCDSLLSHLATTHGCWFGAGHTGNTWSLEDLLGVIQSSRGLLSLQGHVQAEAACVAPSGCWGRLPTSHHLWGPARRWQQALVLGCVARQGQQKRLCGAHSACQRWEGRF